MWVKDLNLKQADKDIIMTSASMLNDRHMYAAHKLLCIQFPKFEGCYSTLLVQGHCFPPVTNTDSSGSYVAIMLVN